MNFQSSQIGQGFWMISILAVMGFPVVAQDEKNAPESPSAQPHLEGMVKISTARRSLDLKMTTLCSADRVRSSGPHESSAVLVYANQKLIEYKKAHPEQSEYPLGSVLLKEKYAGLKTAAPHLATIMRRTAEKGGINDWDFSVISLPDGKPQAMTTNEKAACADCHSKFEAQGFISHYSNSMLWSIGKDAEESSASSSEKKSD
jgi:hypothetical protein